MHPKTWVPESVSESEDKVNSINTHTALGEGVCSSGSNGSICEEGVVAASLGAGLFKARGSHESW